MIRAWRNECFAESTPILRLSSGLLIFINTHNVVITQSTCSNAIRILGSNCRTQSPVSLSIELEEGRSNASCLTNSRAMTSEPLPIHFKSLDLLSSDPRPTLVKVPLLQRRSCMARPLPGLCGSLQCTLMRSSLLHAAYQHTDAPASRARSSPESFYRNI